MFISKNEYMILKDFEKQAKALAGECKKLARKNVELEQVLTGVKETQTEEFLKEQKLWNNFWSYDGTPQGEVS